MNEQRTPIVKDKEKDPLKQMRKTSKKEGAQNGRKHQQTISQKPTSISSYNNADFERDTQSNFGFSYQKMNDMSMKASPTKAIRFANDNEKASTPKIVNKS